MSANDTAYLSESIEELDMALARLNGVICCLYIIASELGCDSASPANEAFYACLAGAEKFRENAQRASDAIHGITKGAVL